MVVIHDETLSADAANFDVQNIPQGYKHLMVELFARGTNGAVQRVRVRYNNDSGSNYTVYEQEGNSSPASAVETSGKVGWVPGTDAASGTAASMVYDLLDYAGTTFHKIASLNNLLVYGGGPTVEGHRVGHRWLDTSAVNRITLFPAAGSFAAGSRLTIYGIGGPPIAPPGDDPVFDLFGTPDTAFEFDTASLAGLTALSTTPDVENADTTTGGCYFLQDNSASNSVCGRYITAPSPPFTAITFVADDTVRAESNRVCLFVGETTPGKLEFVAHRASTRQMYCEYYTTPTAFNAFFGSSFNTYEPPYYLAIRVNNANSVDYLFSQNGLLWVACATARDPDFTIASVGLAINSENSDGMAAAFDYIRVWESALTFPGVY